MELSVRPMWLIRLAVFLVVVLWCGVAAAIVFWTNFTPTIKLQFIMGETIVVLVGIILYQRFNGTIQTVRVSADTGHALELFSGLYQNSPVPYVRAGINGVIIDANAAAIRLFGETSEAVVRQNLFARLSAEGRLDTHISMIPEIVRTGTFVNDEEAVFTRADKEIRWVRISAFPYAHKTEMLVTLIDITKQKNIDTAKSEFVSLASHQLRTPIASIKWNLELMQSPKIGALNEAQQTYLEKINRSAERMSLLVKDFLDASHLEMGTFTTEITTVTLRDFIEDQIDEFELKITQKQLQIERDFLENALVIEVDAHLLRVTLNNLISNAVKYTPEGGIVRLSYAVVNNQIEIRVRDTGMGIPAADQDKLFTKFFRTEQARHSLIEGTGIGLYIVQQAVKLMGGALSFASQEGVGTEFLIVLPYNRP